MEVLVAFLTLRPNTSTQYPANSQFSVLNVLSPSEGLFVIEIQVPESLLQQQKQKNRAIRVIRARKTA